MRFADPDVPSNNLRLFSLHSVNKTEKTLRFGRNFGTNLRGNPTRETFITIIRFSGFKKVLLPHLSPFVDFLRKALKLKRKESNRRYKRKKMGERSKGET